MGGYVNGLQTNIRNEAPHSLFIHCCAHRLNLVVTTRKLLYIPINDIFTPLLGISVFLKKSFFHICKPMKPIGVHV